MQHCKIHPVNPSLLLLTHHLNISAKNIVQQGLHSRKCTNGVSPTKNHFIHTHSPSATTNLLSANRGSQCTSLTQALSSFGKFLYSSSSSFSPSSEFGVAARAEVLFLAFCKAASDKARSARCKKRVASGAYVAKRCEEG